MTDDAEHLKCQVMQNRRPAIGAKRLGRPVMVSPDRIWLEESSSFSPKSIVDETAVCYAISVPQNGTPSAKQPYPFACMGR
jgi:hypothetical protein